MLGFQFMYPGNHRMHPVARLQFGIGVVSNALSQLQISYKTWNIICLFEHLSLLI